MGFLLFGIVCVLAYIVISNVLTAPVDLKDDEVIRFEVVENDTFYSLGKKLLEQDLIKSEFAYKIYIKFDIIEKTLGQTTIVISFHKLEKTIDYLFD